MNLNVHIVRYMSVTDKRKNNEQLTTMNVGGMIIISTSGRNIR